MKPSVKGRLLPSRNAAEELLDASRTQQRLKPVRLELREVTELIRTPNIPIPYALVDGKIIEESGAAEEFELATEEFRRTLLQRLELTSRKEVVIYVHGYRNTFKDSAFSMAELWHFLGRIGVPIVYSWPSGYPGLFGYTYDRESSEFTVHHLREVLNLVASLPEERRSADFMMEYRSKFVPFFWSLDCQHFLPHSAVRWAVGQVH